MQGIQALPPLYRESFVLKHVEGLGYDEMSEILGAPSRHPQDAGLQGPHAAVPFARRTSKEYGDEDTTNSFSGFSTRSSPPTSAIQFIVALGRDQMLRDRVLEIEQLVLDAAKLPRPAVPAWICCTGHGADRRRRDAASEIARRSVARDRRLDVESSDRGDCGRRGAAVEPGGCRSDRVPRAGRDRRQSSRPGLRWRDGVRGGAPLLQPPRPLQSGGARAPRRRAAGRQGRAGRR